MDKISFIAPCFNEESVIEEYYSRLCEIAKQYDQYLFEFVVVNDASYRASTSLTDPASISLAG
ncbi:glycosyltransferase [Vibrio alginolyticus]|uniref:glycosyltransferase n=1 Tax=Vibrio alginolyticus TaxID=663 RepID=UPI001EFEC8A8|nr:glycosyltransferase [Vibrio alginolyticus]MCG9763937.1 glycosyltransferase [Vibrio alginolyticus]